MKPVTLKVRRKRLRKLADKIEKHENKFDMTGWLDTNRDFDLTDEELVEELIKKGRPICNTTACAAGWAVIMFGSPKQIRKCVLEEGSWSDTAQKLLGMTDQETNLFGMVHAGVHSVATNLREMADA
jgi:hypothetical protein